MKNEFVITADIRGHTYYLRIQETDKVRHVSYQGIIDNATKFENESEARSQMRVTVSDWYLQVESPGHTDLGTERPLLPTTLRQLRAHEGLSQQELADKLGIPQSTYGYYETPHAQPSLDTIIALARYYCITIDDLVKGRTATADIRYRTN